jgi:hypothetical protein
MIHGLKKEIRDMDSRLSKRKATSSLTISYKKPKAVIYAG